MMAKPPIRVLLVEDNPGDALLIREMLSESKDPSFELTRVERLDAARDAIEQHPFALVLLDLSLPDSQGLDTFRGLRKTGPRLPVVVLTGLDDEGQGIQAIREGAQDYLLKDRITDRELAHSLQYALQRHERQQKREESLRLMEAELRVARKIHRDLLPRVSPGLPGYDIFGASRSASALGGDLFQYLRLSDGSHALAVGDVTGHGIGPALLMAAIRSYLRAFAQTQSDVGQVLKLTNRLFAEDVTDGINCSLLLAKLNPSGRSLEYASAGHPPGLVISADGVLKARLNSTGVLLGIQANEEFPVNPPIPLRTGDVVLLLTDGVVDALSIEQERFGVERALEVLRTVRAESARQIVEAIFRVVADFAKDEAQSDDITAVVIKVTG
jgi:sigma-B regulation protein RsbU (phosphoserine phosphatase)